MITRPVSFKGTQEERQHNYNTHYFIEERCSYCDCRPYGACAEYPCGADVPMETVDPASGDYVPSTIEILIASSKR